MLAPSGLQKNDNKQEEDDLAKAIAASLGIISFHSPFNIKK